MGTDHEGMIFMLVFTAKKKPGNKSRAQCCNQMYYESASLKPMPVDCEPDTLTPRT